MEDGEATLSERLTDIGLDEKEARVLILLSTSEPLKASEVGRTVGISRMDSYNTLKRLQERGLVLSTLDKPMRFTGLSIQEIFQQLINHEEQELRRIKYHLDELKKGKIGRFNSTNMASKEPLFTVVKERSYIQAAMERVISDSEVEAWILLGKFGILHLVKSGALNALNEAANRGVKIRVLATLENNTLKFYDKLDQRIEIRHSDSVSMNGCIIDGEVAVQNVSMENNPVGRGKDDAALVIEAPTFLTTQTELIDETWKNATPLTTAKSLIAKGENTKPLSINLGTGSFYRRFKEIIANDISDQHPENQQWTNAILRNNQGTVGDQPHLPQLEMLGLDISDIMRIIGKRIGEEITNELEQITDNDSEFWQALTQEWIEMGMGRMEVIGEPLISIKVHDAGACGKAPQFGSPFCHLDEGILEGIIETRLGISTIAVERKCTGEGVKNCYFQILFDEINT